MELVVADDGRGLGVPQFGGGSHHGLVGRAERAREAGGWLVVAPNRPSGTQVVLRLPVPDVSPG
jgi:signal transduction histidine kinase